MNYRFRMTPEETRAKITTVAGEQFRRMGYAKTTVADIAQALGMSSANVYRFFESKTAINNAICQRYMAECDERLRAIVHGPGSAAQRLRSLALTLLDFNRTTFTDEHRLHDMVTVATEENWPAIEQHFERIRCSYEEIIRSGIETGEFFDDDPGTTSDTIKSMFVITCHPQLIAQCAGDDLDNLTHRIADMALRALTSLKA
jgi:AcrR family transcriptional regulator